MSACPKLKLPLNVTFDFEKDYYHQTPEWRSKPVIYCLISMTPTLASAPSPREVWLLDSCQYHMAELG